MVYVRVGRISVLLCWILHASRGSSNFAAKGIRHPEALVEFAQESRPCEWSQSLFTALDHERTIESRGQSMVGVTHRMSVLA